jgi:hypothetical protein
MKQAYGGGTKVIHLCRFVRMYVEKHDKIRRNIIIAVNEFLNFVISNDLTDEDEKPVKSSGLWMPETHFNS